MVQIGLQGTRAVNQPAVFILLALLILVKPRVSLYLFIIISPLVSVYHELHFDPRLWWAAALAVRAVFPIDVDKLWDDGRIIVSVIFFLVYVEVVFLLSSRGIPADDLSGAQNTVFFVVAAGLFVFAVYRLVGTDTEVVRVVMSLAIAVCCVGLYAVWQVHVANMLGQPIRAGSTLINANTLSSYMSLMAITLATSWRFVPGKWNRLLVGAAFLLAVVSVWLSLSRAGAIALLIGLLLWWSSRNRKLGVRKSAILAVLSCGVIFLAFVYLRSYRLQIASDASDEQAQLVMDISQSFDDYTRYQAATYALKEWTLHPIVGIGFGVFPSINYRNNGFYVGSHNTLVEILVGTGLIGLTFILHIVRQFWKRLNRTGKFLFAPIAVCFIVNSLFGDLLQEIAVLEILSVGYLVCVYRGRQIDAFPTFHVQ